MVVKIIKGIGFLLLSALVSFVIVLIFGYLSYNGLFQRWHRIGTLNGERIIKIIDIGVVETESGDLYQHNPFSTGIFDNVAQWIKINDISNIRIWEASRLEHCQTFSFLPFGQSFFIDSKKACVDRVGTATLVYAINKQGDLYIWFNNHGWEYNGFGEFVVFPIFAAFLGTIIGIFIMVINSVIKYKRRKNKSL